MDDGLKQRIIGAFVLVALVVIFVPIFFDKDRIVPLDQTSLIPLQPDIDAVELIIPDSTVQEESEVFNAKDVFTPNETQPQTMVEEAPQISEKGMPLSWTLQIASFREEKRAVELRDKLIADGYSAYTKEVETNRGTMMRVYVGPKLNKNSLIAQKKKIDKEYNLSALILRFSS